MRGREAGACLVLVLGLGLGAAPPAEGRDLQPGAVPMVIRDAIANSDIDAWESALDGVVEAGEEGVPVLVELLHDADPRVRILALEGARRIPGEATTALALDGIQDSDGVVRGLAREIIQERRPAGAIVPLIASLEKVPAEEKVEVVRALQDLTRMRMGDAPEGWRAWWAQARDQFHPAPPAQPGEASPTPDGPLYYGETVTSRRVVFVIDRSLSMQWGGRIERARSQLIETIEGLPPDAFFTVVFFARQVSVWKPRLAPATDESKESAVRWIKAHGITFATNTWGALEAALSIPQADTIYLLSDGDPTAGRFTDPTRIRRQLRLANTFKRMRLFTIGFFFGDVPEQYRPQTRQVQATRRFMRQIAQENRGRFVEVLR